MSDSFVTPWTVVLQALLSMGFPRQEYRSGLPFPSPGNLHDPGTETGSPALAGGFFTTAPQWLKIHLPMKKNHRCGLDPWLRKTLWSRKWQPTPVFLPGKFHGQRSLGATICGIPKSQTWLSIHTDYSIWCYHQNAGWCFQGHHWAGDLQMELGKVKMPQN